MVFRDYKGMIDQDVVIDYDDIMMVNGRKVDGGFGEKYLYLRSEAPGNGRSSFSGRQIPLPVG